MTTDLYELEAGYYDGETPRDYYDADGNIITKEDALYAIINNIDEITVKVDNDYENTPALFIQVDYDDASMFTTFMDLASIVFPDIDQTYFRKLDEPMECIYLPEENVYTAEEKINALIEQIKNKL